MNRLGLDIGYNAVKATNGVKTINFISAVGSHFDITFSVNAQNGVQKFVFPRKFTLGNGMMAYSRMITNRDDRERTHSEQYEDLFLGVLAELAISDEPVQIVTGLPISYFREDKPVLIERLQKWHYFQREGEPKRGVYVEKVTVLPQPIGTLLDYCLNDSGEIINPEIAKGHVAILDIGGKTTNLLHAHKLSTVDYETRSVNRGGWDMVSQLRSHLEEHYAGLKERPMPNHEIASMLMTKAFRYEGKNIDITPVVDNILKEFTAAMIADITNTWKGLSLFDAILATGGGSLLVGKLLQQEIKRLTVVSDPVHANSKGFRKYAERG